MSVTQELMVNYQHIISDLKLVMGGEGIFDVEVNGEMLYSKEATNCKPEEGEVLDLFEKLIEPTGVKRYGQE